MIRPLVYGKYNSSAKFTNGCLVFCQRIRGGDKRYDSKFNFGEHKRCY